MTDLFADKAAQYDDQPLPQRLSAGIFAALDARLPLAPEWTVLDFGAGTGLLTGRLASRVRRVLAVDVSAAMLAQLGAKPALVGKVEAIHRDLLREPLAERVELVVSAMALHHVEDTDRLLAVLHAHLVEGGRIALADLDREDGDLHPPGTEGVFHHGFDHAALAGRMRAAGFEEVEIATIFSVEKEGRPYGVFLATARRPGPASGARGAPTADQRP